MTLRPEALQQRRQRRQAIMAGGGADKIKERREQGILSARERLAALFQPGTFQETVSCGEVCCCNVLASGVVPQIALVLGPCAGGAAYSPALNDFIIMTRHNAHMFITGPEVIKAVTGRATTMDEVGSPEMRATVSGNMHFVADDDRHAIQLAQQLLSQMGADFVHAWPCAEIAVMGAQGAVNLLYRRELAEAADRKAKAEEPSARYRDEFASPYLSASRGYITDVIEPAETRSVLALSLRKTLHKRELRPAKKHGNVPLSRPSRRRNVTNGVTR